MFCRTTVAIGVVILTGGVLALRQVSSTGDVPALETPAWQSGAPEYGDQIMIRGDTQAERGSLLLKHSNRDVVYRYDPRTRTLTSAPNQEWDRAGGPVAECSKQFTPPQEVLRIDQQSHRLMAGNRQIATAGANVLTVVASPDNRFAAVLSSGTIQPSILPFLGAGGGSGQHYHQIVSLPEAVVLGNAVRLPKRRDRDVLGACWTPQEKALVYYDILFSYVSVVEPVA